MSLSFRDLSFYVAERLLILLPHAEYTTPGCVVLAPCLLYGLESCPKLTFWYHRFLSTDKVVHDEHFLGGTYDLLTAFMDHDCLHQEARVHDCRELVLDSYDIVVYQLCFEFDVGFTQYRANPFGKHDIFRERIGVREDIEVVHSCCLEVCQYQLQWSRLSHREYHALADTMQFMTYTGYIVRC